MLWTCVLYLAGSNPEGATAILSEVVSDFVYSLQANYVILPRLKHYHVLSRHRNSSTNSNTVQTLYSDNKVKRISERTRRRSKMINDYAVSAWKKGSMTEEHHEEFLKHFAPENSRI